MSVPVSEEKRRLPVIVIGGGGHARVLIDALKCSGHSLIGYTDLAGNGLTGGDPGIVYLGDDSKILEFAPEEVRLVNGLGSVSTSGKRVSVYRVWKQNGYTFSSVIHPSAVVAQSVTLGEGVQIMAGAVIQPSARIGENSIVNTRAGIDHDCAIGAHVHIAPGVTLCGGVSVGEMSHVGSGATIIQGIQVGEKAVVGAGAVVIRDVASNSTVVGVPAAETLSGNRRKEQGR